MRPSVSKLMTEGYQRWSSYCGHWEDGPCSRCPGEEGLYVVFCSGVGYVVTL